MRYFLRQCELERPVARGVERHQAWIPEFFATLQRVLKFEDSALGDGWVVVQIGARRSSEEANERSMDYRRHRLGSDTGRKQSLTPSRC